MTTAVAGNNKKKRPPTISKQVADHIKTLPTETLKDLTELAKLLTESDDDEERSEIAKTVMEILWPKSLWSVTAPEHSADEERRATQKLEEWRKKVGREIASRRQQKQWSQQTLADKAGLPQSHVSRLETGKHVPTHLTLKKVAKALGVPASKLDPGFDD